LSTNRPVTQFNFFDFFISSNILLTLNIRYDSMRLLIFLITIFVSKASFSQSNLICNNQKLTVVKSSLFINGYEQKQFISFQKMDGDFVLGLNNPTYKIVGFRFILSCPTKSVLYDVISKEYLGNRIKSKDPILNSIDISDFITIDCITVEKNGIKYSLPSLIFEIVE